jgi:hypothetical protein
MQWSKLKKNVESFLCESLKERVELFTTWYKDGGSPGRACGMILVDKKEVFTANTDQWIAMSKEKSKEDLYKLGIFEETEFRNSLKEYLHLSIDDALGSDNIIVKALAIVDKRVGKRRLPELKILEGEHKFIKFMYNLRCQAEGIEK